MQIKDDTVRPTRCGKGGKHSVGVSVRKRPMDGNGWFHMVSAPKVTFKKGFKNDFNISMTGRGLCDAPRLENDCLDRDSSLKFISATLFGGNMSNAWLSIYMATYIYPLRVRTIKFSAQNLGNDHGLGLVSDPARSLSDRRATL